MKKKVSICWFRQDLRLHDNPALVRAVENGTVLPIYIYDDVNAEDYDLGAASKWWLHHALSDLNSSLNNKISFYKNNPLDVLKRLISRFDVSGVYWNRCYEPWQIKRDSEIKTYLSEKGIDAQSFNGLLLWEPWNINKDDGTPYKVFTPYYRKGCLKAPSPRQPLPKPDLSAIAFDESDSCTIDSLSLLPDIAWDKEMIEFWSIGESHAKSCLEMFIAHGLGNYKEGRNIPAKPYVSRMSPYLRFGHISPNQIWYRIRETGENINVDHYCSELGWREFSYSQLYHNPTLPVENLHKKFDAFPWIDNKTLLEAWQKGKTGVPMVDAGMRELWRTGYMHNRVRMIVGSYLVKNLRLHWKHGERWFWDTLVDADLANNSASWQWVAGCGADAAPYFRIFNPVTQGLKFDPNGEYVRKYVPELKDLPDKYLFAPWEAPGSILMDAGVTLGKTYPYPIVDLKKSREDALVAFQSLKK
ncbi:DNA photolyase family protein [Chlamydiia bacterium]|nr:DNA photolyase family protein [Chlamydiia bacterium]